MLHDRAVVVWPHDGPCTRRVTERNRGDHHGTSKSSPRAAPHLVVDDAAAAIDFYVKAFGADGVRPGARTRTAKLMHAALRINGSLVMLNDDFPEFNDGKSTTPKALGGTPVTIHLHGPDVDAEFQRAVDAGATVVHPLEDQFWGDRYGVVRDPFGHQWSLGQPVREVSPEEIAEAMKQQLASTWKPLLSAAIRRAIACGSAVLGRPRRRPACRQWR